MDTLETRFAPPEKADTQSVENDHHHFADNLLLNKALNSVHDVFMILNQERQIIYANSALCKLLGFDKSAELCGLRPGEALKCDHSDDMEAGCGTSEFCSECGAVNAILASQQGREVVRECRITQKETRTALDLKVSAIPITEKGTHFTVLAVKDISDVKRKEMLEHVFFHDILNTAGGIQGITSVLSNTGSDRMDTMILSIKESAQLLIEEINAQKQLFSAESGELHLNLSETTSFSVLHDIIVLYGKHEVSRNRKMKLDEHATDALLITDAPLLRRVVGNMTKNALEATPSGGTVTLSSDFNEETQSVEFRVQNPGFIPRNAQLQIFQRSFSTKGKGRGLGTYSIKLLGERYLKGTVSFESSEEKGTTFRIVLPAETAPPASVTAAKPEQTEAKTQSPLFEIPEVGDVIDTQALLEAVETRLSDMLKEIQATMIMSNIELFAQELSLLGQKHQFRAFSDLGEQLNVLIQAFDVGKIQRLLDSYPEIIKKLKEHNPET